MSIVDVPYETFTEYILPHITVKEVGALAMMCKDLKGFCDDNETWKVLYLRTVSWKITDKSVHIAHKLLFHQSFNRHNGHHGLHCSCCPSYSVSEKLNLSAKIIVHPRRLRDYNQPINQQPDDVKEARRIYKNAYIGAWSKHNLDRGLSTVNLCQNPSHYKTETLDIPGCRNFKSFKKETLKKERTKAKRPIATVSKTLKRQEEEIARCERVIEHHKNMLARARRENAETLVKTSRGRRLVERLSGAVDALKPKPKPKKKQKRIKQTEKQLAN